MHVRGSDEHYAQLVTEHAIQSPLTSAPYPAEHAVQSATLTGHDKHLTVSVHGRHVLPLSWNPGSH